MSRKLYPALTNANNPMFPLSLFKMFHIVVLSLLWSVAGAQETTLDSKKIKSLHAALQKRPHSQSLFSRFYESWLDETDSNSLENFLKQRTTPNDQVIYAYFCLRHNKTREAISLLRSVVSTPDIEKSLKTHSLLELGKLEARNRNYDQALKDFSAAAKTHPIDSSPLSVELTKAHGKLLINYGKIDTALQMWEELIAKNPKEYSLHEEIVDLLFVLGKTKEAVESQKALITKLRSERQEYEAVVATVNLGKLYSRNQPEQAVSIWKQALKRTGKQSWLEKEIISLTQASFRQKDDILGLKNAITEMIKAEPDRIFLQISLAKILTELGENKPALKKWQDIIKKTPGDSELRIEYIAALAKLDNPQTAATLVAELSKMEPENQELLFWEADFLFQAGKGDLAANRIFSYLRQSKQTETDHFKAVNKLIQYSRKADAIELFEVMLTKFPGNQSIVDRYASYIYNHDRERAIALWTAKALTGSVDELIHNVQQLTSRQETKTAIQALEKRLLEFADDRNVLKNYCELALRSGLEEKALPYAISLAELPSSPEELLKTAKLINLISRQITNGYETTIALLNKNSIPVQSLNYWLNAKHIDFEIYEKQLLDSANNLPPSTAVFPLELLLTLYEEKKHWNKAAETLDSIFKSGGKKNPKNIEKIIQYYINQNKPKPAIQWISEWKKLAPYNSRPWLLESQQLEKQGNLSEALECIQRASRRFEERPILTRLASLYLKNRNPIEAEKIYWRLFETASDSMKKKQWITRIADLSNETGRIDETLIVLRKRRKTNPNSIDLTLALAETNRIANRSSKYREYLQIASNQDPRNIALVHEMAEFDLKNGQHELALTALKSIGGRDSSSSTFSKIAQINLAMGNAKQALSPIPVGILTETKIIELATKALQLGEWEAVATFLGNELVHHPESLKINLLYGLTLIESLQFDLAKTQLARLLRYDYPHTAFSPARTINQPYYQWVNSYINSNSYRAFCNNGENFRGTAFTVSNNFVDFLMPQNPTSLRGTLAGLVNSLPEFKGNKTAIQFLRNQGLPKQEIKIAEALSKYSFDYLSVSEKSKLTPKIYTILHQTQPNVADIAETYLATNQGPTLPSAWKTIAENKGVEYALNIAISKYEIERISYYLKAKPKISNENLSKLMMLHSHPKLNAEVRKQIESLVFKSEEINDNSNLSMGIRKILFASRTNTEQWTHLMKKYQSHPDFEMLLIFKTFWGNRFQSKSFHFFDPTYKKSITGKIAAFESKPHLLLSLAWSTGNKNYEKTALSALNKINDNSEGGFIEAVLLAEQFRRDLPEKKTKKQCRAYIEILENARNIPKLAPHLQLPIDWEIVAIVKAHGDTLKSSGITAGQRLLKSGQLSTYEQIQLKSLMAKWGVISAENILKTVAPKLKVQNLARFYNYQSHNGGKSLPISEQTNIATIQSHFGTNNHFYHNQYRNFNAGVFSSYAKSLEQKVYELNTKGLSSTSLMRYELPSKAYHILSLPDSSSLFLWAHDLLSKEGERDTFLETLEPLKQRTVHGELQYATTCEVLRRFDLALPIYQTFLQKEPDNPILVFRVLNCLAHIDFEQAFPRIQQLITSKDTSEALFSETIRLAFDLLPKESATFSEKLEVIVAALSDSRVDPIYSRNTFQKLFYRFEQNEITDITLENYIMVCSKYIEAFPKSAQKLYNQVKTKSISDSAKSIVRRKTIKTIISQSNGNLFLKSGGIPPLVDEIKEAYQNRDRSSAFAIVEQIKASPNKTRAALVESFIALYFCHEKEFFQKTNNFITLSKQRGVSWAYYISHIGRARPKTQSAELTLFVLDQWEEKERFPKDYLFEATIQIRKQKDLAYFHSFLKKVVSKFLSYGQANTSFSKWISDKSSNDNRRVDLSQYFSKLLSNPATVYGTIEFLREENVLNSFNSSIKLDYYKFEDIRDLFTYSELLGSFENYPLYPSSKDSFDLDYTTKSYINTEIYRVISRNRSKLNGLSSLLPKRKSPTFGSLLLKAALSDHYEQQALAYLTAFSKVPSTDFKQNGTIIGFAADLVNFDKLDPNKIALEHKPLLETYRDKNQKLMQLAIARLTSQESLADVEFGEPIYKTLRSYLPYDWKTVAETIEILVAASRAEISEAPLFIGSVLKSTIDQRYPVESSLLQLYLFNSKVISPPGYWNNCTDQFRRHLDDQKPQERIKTIETYIAPFEKELNRGKFLEQRPLFLIFASLFRYENDKKVESWASSKEVAQKYPNIAPYLKTAILLKSYDHDYKAMPPELAKSLKQLLQHRDDDLQVRLAIAKSILDHFYVAPFDLTQISFEILTEAMANPAQITKDTFDQILGTYCLREELVLDKNADRPNLELFLDRFRDYQQTIGDRNHFSKQRYGTLSLLYASMGDDKTAWKLITKIQQSRAPFVPDLIRLGSYELAAKLIEDHQFEILANTNSEFNRVFDEEQAQALEGFINHTSNRKPWVSRIGELININLQDKPAKGKNQWRNYENRHMDFAKKLRLSDYPSDRARTTVLKHLSEAHPPTLTITAPLFSQVNKEFGIENILTMSDSHKRGRALQSFASLLEKELQIGNTTRWIDSIQSKALKSKSSTSIQARKQLYQCLEILSKQWTYLPETINSKSAFNIAFADPDYKISDRTLAAYFAIHYSASQHEQLSNSIAALPDIAKDRVLAACCDADLFNEAMNLIRWNVEGDVLQRFISDCERSDFEGVNPLMLSGSLNFNSLRVLNFISEPDSHLRQKGPLSSEDYLGTLIAQQPDENLAEKMVNIALNITDNEIKQYSAQGLLEGILKNDDGRLWNSLNLYLKIIQNPSNNVELHIPRFDEVRRFRSIMENHSPSIMQAESLLQTAFASIDEQPTNGFFFPAFVSSFYAMENQFHVKHYIQCAQRIDHPAIDEFLFAGQYVLYRNHPSNEGFQPWIQTAIQRVQNRECDLRARLALINSILQIRELPEEFLCAAINTLEEAHRSGRNLKLPTFSLANHFQKLPKTDRWMEAAKVLVSLPGFKLEFSGVRSCVLKLALQIKDEALIEKCLKQFEASRSDSIHAIDLLVRNQRYEKAIELIKEKKNNSYSFPVYTDELHRNIPEFLLEIDNLDTRFYTELELANFRDARIPEKDLPNRRTRLTEFAKKFSSFEFRSDTQRGECVKILNQNWYLGNFVELAPVSEAVFQVSQGNLARFKKALADTSIDKVSLVRTLNSMVFEEINSADQNQLKLLSEAYQLICQCFEDKIPHKRYDTPVYRNRKKSFLAQLDRLHIEATLFDRWIRSLLDTKNLNSSPAPLNEKHVNYLSLIARPNLVSFWNPSVRSKQQEKILVKSVIEHVAKRLATFDSVDDQAFLMDLIQHRVLDEEAVAKYGEKLAHDWKPNGLVAMELAEFYLLKGNNKKGRELALLANEGYLRKNHSSFESFSDAKIRINYLLKPLGDAELMRNIYATTDFEGEKIQFFKDLIIEFGPTTNRKVDTQYSTFKLIPCLVSWANAKQLCESMGGRLAVVSNEETLAALKPLIKDKRYWLGASDRQNEGEWIWSDGSTMTLSNWLQPAPKRVRGNDDYLVINPDGSWSAQRPSYNRKNGPHGFICEWLKPESNKSPNE